MSYTLNKRGAQIDAIFLRAEAGGTIDDAIALKAPLASPALTGTPTAPTAAAGTDTTQIATTEFVTDAVQAEAEADALRYAPAIVVPTSSAPVASFSNGADGVPLKSATFQIVPAQSGSGTPAPDNIRPISGWTGAKISRTGKNLYNKSADTDGYYLSAAGTLTSNASYHVSDYMPVTGAAITYQGLANPGNNPRSCWYDADKNFLSSFSRSTGANTVTIPSGAAFVRFSVVDTDVNTLMVELGSTASDYEAFGTTATLDWSTYGTVYSGTLQYLGGGAWRLTKTMERIDLGTLAWTRDSSGAFYATVSGIKNGIRPMLCEALDYYSGNFQLSQYSSYADNIIGGNVNGGAFVYVKCTTYSTAADFKTAMGGKYLVYTLATPTVYDLTGADVLTLLGSNVIWADVGSAAVEYRADTKLYIDGQIAALQALVLENNG